MKAALSSSVLGVVVHAHAFASMLELNLPARLKTTHKILTVVFTRVCVEFALPKLTELEYTQLARVGSAISRSLQSA